MSMGIQKAIELHEREEQRVRKTKPKQKTGDGVVRVDADVLKHLEKHALKFESRRAVLRRLLGFPPKQKLLPGPKRRKHAR